MEIGEVKQKKDELREGVVKLLDGFSAETGLKVEEIKVDKIYRSVPDEAYSHSVSLRVEV